MANGGEREGKASRKNKFALLAAAVRSNAFNLQSPHNRWLCILYRGIENGR